MDMRNPQSARSHLQLVEKPYQEKEDVAGYRQAEIDVLYVVLRAGWRAWDAAATIPDEAFQDQNHKDIFGLMRFEAESGQEPNFTTMTRATHDYFYRYGGENLELILPKIFQAGMGNLSQLQTTVLRLKSFHALKKEQQAIKGLMTELGMGGQYRTQAWRMLEKKKAEVDKIILKKSGVRLDQDSQGLLDHLFGEDKANYSYIPTGFKGLDEGIGGLNYPGMVLLGGPTGSGKSTLAVNILTHAAESGIMAALYGLEMPIEENYARILASFTGFSENQILNGDLSKEHWPMIQEAAERAESMRIFISDSLKHLEDIKQDIAIRALEGFKLFVVDHIKIVKTEGRDFLERIENVSRDLAEMAQKYQVCILVLAHPNKSRDKTTAASTDWLPGHISDHATQVFILNLPEGEGSVTRELTLVKGRRGSRRITVRLHIPNGDSLFKQISP